VAGGSSGGIVSALGFSTGGNSRLLPVRGFDSGVRAGTKAWTATAEYRLPIALVGRRPAVSPFYIDRISGAAFVDAGDAWCTGLADDLYGSCQRARGQPPLVSAGAELAIDMSFARIIATRVRAGLAFPVQGPSSSPMLYLQAGQSF
jgi:outer membrane protein assembly factor BamA